MLDELRRAENDIKNIVSELKGILRISTQCYTCYNWLPDLLTLFNENLPGVEIVVEATREPIQFLLDGKLDVAVVKKSSRQKINLQTPFQK